LCKETTASTHIHVNFLKNQGMEINLFVGFQSNVLSWQVGDRMPLTAVLRLQGTHYPKSVKGDLYLFVSKSLVRRQAKGGFTP
jgi:hypothetical protein